MTILFFFLGLIALVMGAELLVRGASRLASDFGISPLVVGLTVVAFGTSSPELAVSVQSVMDGRVDIAIANVVGSNIFNILFILGISASIASLVVADQLIRQEVPIMIGASVLLLLFALDGGINRWEGLALFGLMIAYTSFLIVQARRKGHEALEAEVESELESAPSWRQSTAVQVLLVVAGLGLLVVGSNWLVEAAITFATYLGVSEVVIGLTIIAAGTSLPEVATSVMASVRGHRDIAVGNVIGSNTFNILGVLGASAMLAPADLPVAPSILSFDLPVMLAAAIGALPIFLTGRSISRWEGGVFLLFYTIYTAYLVLSAQEHDALDSFGSLVVGFVAPILVVTLVVTLLRNR